MLVEAIKNLQAQLLSDMERFGNLMNRYALGETAVKDQRDQLEGAVEVKLAILEGLKRLRNEMGVVELSEPEEDFEEDEEW